ncbi:hypothetical protein ACFSTA_20445 [Ornithinibacillus salinisoli]|uniref:Uncharacterized protein n=1 Tax=Ornithinibacillus salinisoli TaxID=1848459 RepID=A0ABW4W7Y5_9BACI
MIWGELALFVEKIPTSTRLILKWNSGLTIMCEFDTQHYTDNNLDEDDPGYEEFQGVLFLVEEIIQDGNEEIVNFGVGNLIELSYKNEPDIIMDLNREVLWKKAEK